MPVLQFKGKTAVESYHYTVPHHTFDFDSKLSLLPRGADPSLEGNLIIEGDNLLASIAHRLVSNKWRSMNRSWHVMSLKSRHLHKTVYRREERCREPFSSITSGNTPDTLASPTSR